MFRRVSKKKLSQDHGMVLPKFGMLRLASAKRHCQGIHMPWLHFLYLMESSLQEVKTRKLECGTLVNSKKSLKLMVILLEPLQKFHKFKDLRLVLMTK